MSVFEVNPRRSSVAIVGGGLAGLAAGSALADAGYQVELFERRPYLGGRASSYELPGSGEVVDNCQHVLLGCCTNLIDFYRRLGVEQQIRWYDEITFILPGGRCSTLKPGALPPPFHAAPSFLDSAVLDLKDKLAIARAMMAFVPGLPKKDDGENFLSWLLRHGQTQRAINRFWMPVLVSALNEDLDRMSVRYAAQVFRESFLKSAEAGRMGVPSVPLSQLYGTAAEYIEARGGTVHMRAAVESIRADADGVQLCVGGEDVRADYAILATPFNGVEKLLPDAPEFAPLRDQVRKIGSHLRSLGYICGSTARSRLWSMRCCWSAPFNGCSRSRRYWRLARILAQNGSYLELVVSSSKTLVEKSRAEIIEMAVKELSEFFPVAREAKLMKATVIKEVHATFSPTPGSDAFRPSHVSPWPRFFLAGDWTATGWPSTMEGAVRSGYGAAEAVTNAASDTNRFLVPDLPAKGLMRLFG